MNIGFDAKRAFHNQTGLGHYSRTLIHSLAGCFPQHEYFLFNPKASTSFHFNEQNVHEVLPGSFLSKKLSAAWRSNWVKKDLKRLHIDLYHGLSHELPVNINQTGIKSVVTIHDLIHERYPEQYKLMDRQIYTQKFRYACEHADKVIAISEQTKQDIIHFYKTPAEKIEVCYQSCNPAFGNTVSNEERLRIRQQYQLPDQYFLYVGSLIERKNLLNICKAMDLIRAEINFPLVVIGNGHDYKQKVKNYIKEAGLEDRILFLSESSLTKSSPAFQSAVDFPAIYQQAIAMIYPSVFEGFGIPVLEALWSRIPVITSNLSCLPEAGGDGAFYVNPTRPEEIAEQMKRILNDEIFVKQQIEKGWQHAQRFSNVNTAAKVMGVYEQVV
ncbi:MAG: glycosyltransferase family 4 protein [Chitinophagaceae bacterium]|jgi:glycosyltransferase involved in cell wall biosynthesis|nr:glycosyltransferase family 4 protein [Chitinophagaceae bacterium]